MKDEYPVLLFYIFIEYKQMTKRSREHYISRLSLIAQSTATMYTLIIWIWKDEYTKTMYNLETLQISTHI
jgi:hypothetical protein